MINELYSTGWGQLGTPQEWNSGQMGPSPPPSCILEQGGLSQTLDKVPARLKWLLPFPARVEHREKKMQHSPEGLATGSLGIQCSPEVFLVQGHLRAGFERCKVKELSTGGQDCVSWFPKDVLLHRGWDTVTSQAGICWKSLPHGTSNPGSDSCWAARQTRQALHGLHRFSQRTSLLPCRHGKIS